MQGGVSAFAQQLSREQSTVEQFYVPWPFPQKWTRIHFWKSGSKGKDISWQWTELNVPVCFSKTQNAILASSWASFTQCRPPRLSHSQSWYLACTGSSHWDGWIPNSPGPRIYLLLSRSPSRSPSRVKGQGEAPEWEDHPAPHCPC